MYLFQEHQEKYKHFICRDGTHPKDTERQALFYVLAGCHEFVERVNQFYDFRERIIRPESFGEVDLSSGIRSLLELAYNLYNNYPSGTVVDLFANLDERHRWLAVEAIKIRFGVEQVQKQ